MDKMNKAVTILTGFLGSGKTTFLNQMIRRNPNTRYAIIENEFGEEGIDGELILRPEDGVVELNNGCLCCTLNDNLYDILNDLFDRRNEFDEIIIEATGVADPAGLAEPFLSHPLIKEHFPLKGTICLIDTEIVEDQIEETKEALSQITFSDVLILNKTDLVTKDYVLEVQSKMQALNPLAKIYVADEKGFPDFDLSKEKSTKEEGMLIEKLDQDTNHGLDLRPSHHHHDHEHTDEIKSIALKFDQAFDAEMLYHQLFVYLAFQSKGLYRLKGLIHIANDDQQYLLQSVGKRVSLNENRPWKVDEKRESVIVFIGKNLQEKGLKKLLSKCLAKSIANEKVDVS